MEVVGWIRISIRRPCQHCAKSTRLRLDCIQRSVACCAYRCRRILRRNAADSAREVAEIRASPSVLIKGHFEGERLSHAWLKRLRTLYGRLCEPFSIQRCTILQDFAHTISRFFRGLYVPHTRQKHPWYFDPDTNFRLARQRSHCSDNHFTKRPLVLIYFIALYSLVHVFLL